MHFPNPVMSLSYVHCLFKFGLLQHIRCPRYRHFRKSASQARKTVGGLAWQLAGAQGNWLMPDHLCTVGLGNKFTHAVNSFYHSQSHARLVLHRLLSKLSPGPSLIPVVFHNNKLLQAHHPSFPIGLL